MNQAMAHNVHPLLRGVKPCDVNVAATHPLLRVQGLRVAIQGNGTAMYAVQDVDFDIHANEVVCLVGESGSGKSMTAHAIMGLLPEGVRIAGGRILLHGQDVLTLRTSEHRKLRGRKMGMIFQEPMTALNPIMRVGVQVEEVLQLHTDLNAQQRRARVQELFEAVRLPDAPQLARAYPFELSGGQRQRVMIAIALALAPDLLIADEPTTALDVTTQAQILHLIQELQDRLRIGVLFITHDFGVVADIADRIVVMHAGQVLEHGSAQQVLHNPQHAYTQKLLAAVPRLPKKTKETQTETPRRLDKVLLQVENLQKTWNSHGREVPALKNVSLHLHVGETLGVVGESGSGKSTLGRTLVGLYAPDGGSIRLDGQELLGMPERQRRALRNSMQMVFQDPYASLNPRHRVGETIMQGPMAFGTSRGAAQHTAFELLSLVGLDETAAKRYPHQFSGGQRQRICIARALALAPRLLVADEPVSSLDVSVQAQVLALLADIRQRLQLAMLFITHDLRVAAQICDRILVMQHGEIVETGSATDIFFHPQHPYTQALIAAIPGRKITA